MKIIVNCGILDDFEGQDLDACICNQICRSNNIESTKEKLNHAKGAYNTMKHEFVNVS